jgi:Mg-chelatase subunit ChlI
MSSIFPFTAVVGQDEMRLALILNAINPQIGGVLIRGERGTAKSTAARGLAALLPKIRVIADCPFACNPDKTDQQCDNCRARSTGAEVVQVAERPTRFVNLPVSATEDRVVGTLDIEKAIKHGERHFEPGVLAGANRGLLYVDEVNLLDDHVVDLLLDSAAMGINVVEREGISFSHPARFILVGTMNPEEGELRPQLLDRFALCVDIKSISSPEERVKILERSLAYERQPLAFCQDWQPAENALSQRIAHARALLPDVHHAARDLLTISQLTADLQVDGHRGDIVILRTALTHAAYEGRQKVLVRDILAAAELALPHRVRRRPYQPMEGEAPTLSERLEEIRQQNEDIPKPGGEMAEASEEKKTILSS